VVFAEPPKATTKKSLISAYPAAAGDESPHRVELTPCPLPQQTVTFGVILPPGLVQAKVSKLPQTKFGAG
jgi:hypothetical protein